MKSFTSSAASSAHVSSRVRVSVEAERVGCPAARSGPYQVHAAVHDEAPSIAETD